jgi:hypothetical protein
MKPLNADQIAMLRSARPHASYRHSVVIPPAAKSPGPRSTQRKPGDKRKPR